MSRLRGQRFWWLGAFWGVLLLPGCLLHQATVPPPSADSWAGLPVDLQASGLLAPGPSPTMPPASARGEETAPPPRPVQGKDRLQIPPELPGAGVPDLPEMPPRTLPPEERRALIRKRFPPLEPLDGEVEPMLPPGGRPWALADLQALAVQRSPLLPRAAADVEAARGAVVQAGLHPNPTVGYEADQVQPGHGPDHNAGQQGGFVQQIIKLWGKLRLAQAVAAMDYVNAEVAFKRTQVDLATQVRTGYFAVLVARENVLIARALVRLTEEAYRIQIAQVEADQAAGYEPLQFYVQVIQARNVLVLARNRYRSAWKQLAATLDMPKQPPTALAGRADVGIPRFVYEEAVKRVLADHTDVRTAENTILRARHNLRLAEVTPKPDLLTNVVVQHDNAAGNDQFNLQLGLPLPIWDRNQGNIQQAHAQVARAEADLEATRLDLAQRLADAFERYDNARVLLANFRDRILPNQIRAYRALRRRYQTEPDKVSFGDIVLAQQTLAGLFASYLTSLNDQWAAVVSVAGLLQVEDLYGAGHDGQGHAPGPPLAEQLLAPEDCVPAMKGRVRLRPRAWPAPAHQP